MGAARGMVRVRRDALAARMTCPLCQGLLREATAITHCLHTFCQECIMEKINDDEVDCCPVCNIDLGCDPEEKLRPDHNLQDIRNKLFPIKKKKIDSPKAPTALPAKRKQRSLSSLVVDTPSVAKPTGLTGKRTKAKRRASASASRATSSSNNGTMKLPAKSEGRYQKTEKTSALQSTKVATTAKEIESRDQKKIEKASAQQLTKAATDAKKNESRDQKKIEKASAQQSTKAATAANKKQRSTDVEVSIKPSSEDKKNAKKADKVVYAARKAKAPRSTPKIHAAAEEQIKKKGSELPTRKEETENEVNIPGATVAKCSNELSHKEETENEVNIPGTTVENNGTSSEPAPSTDQATTEDNSNQRFSGSASTLHDPITTPVWFSLVSSPNQKGALQLPELSKSYLRIKDGSLQVSFVQRYLAKKLDIGDENEVEITCHGEPVCPSSTVHGLVKLWPRKEPEEPFPASLGAPAKEFVMVLGYRRRHRPLTAASSPRHQTTSPGDPVKLKPPATATAPPETGSALSAPSIRSG